MQAAIHPRDDVAAPYNPGGPTGVHQSGDLRASTALSWPAIFGGAVGAAALSLILLVLGTGLGFSSVSPWSDHGVDATTFGAGTIVWITLTSILASGAGGYLAGRLRTRWVGTHTDEVYFRDTAHGFLAWSLATLVTAAVLTSAIGAIVGAGVGAVGKTAGAVAGTTAAAGTAAVASSAKQGGDQDSTSGYFVDSLFRKPAGDPSAPATAAPADATGPAPAAETARIMAHDLEAGSLGADDTRYLGQLVAQRTGLSQADAEKRVTDTFAKAQAAAADAANKAKQAADTARKASAYAALWLFLSLLVGAFVASLAATYGGRRRDLY